MKQTRKGTCRRLAACAATVLALTGCFHRAEPGDELGSFLTEAERYETVEYTGEAHGGTGICYRGKGENPFVVVLDAGHQEKGNRQQEPLGPDAVETKDKVTTGATGAFTGVRESELNLAVTLALRDELIRRGYTVVMVRETQDVDISNRERALMANAYGADAYVRIHANAHTGPSARGALTMCQSEHNPYPACAAAYADSRALSEILLDAFCEATGMPRRAVVETDTMTGLNWSEVPSTIIEMGFLSNQIDDLLMNTPAFHSSAAIGLANGLDAFLKGR